jgi:hypothetical protein
MPSAVFAGDKVKIDQVLPQSGRRLEETKGHVKRSSADQGGGMVMRLYIRDNSGREMHVTEEATSE